MSYFQRRSSSTSCANIFDPIGFMPCQIDYLIKDAQYLPPEGQRFIIIMSNGVTELQRQRDSLGKNRGICSNTFWIGLIYLAALLKNEHRLSRTTH